MKIPAMSNQPVADKKGNLTDQWRTIIDQLLSQLQKLTSSLKANKIVVTDSNSQLISGDPPFSCTATGLTYTSSSGVLSLTSGYAIPTTTMQVSWNNTSVIVNNATPLDTPNTLVLRDSNGNAAVGLNDSQSTPVLAVDNINRTLFDSFGIRSIDWSQRYLYYSDGSTIAIDYGNGFLYDNSNIESIDFNLRQTFDSTGITTIDFANRALTGTGANTILDWNYCYAFDQFSSISIAWDSRVLYDFNGGNSIDWGNRALYNDLGEITFDYENGVISVHTDYGSMASVNAQAHYLTDTTVNNYLSIDWGNRNLYDQNQIIIFNWNSGIGFYGVNPVTQQIGGAATAGSSYTSNEQDMINAIYTALRNYGLLT